MAEIHIQKKKKSVWPLIIGIIIVLALLALAYWYYTERNNTDLINNSPETSSVIGAFLLPSKTLIS